SVAARPNRRDRTAGAAACSQARREPMIHAREGRAIVAAVLLGLVPGWPVAAIADPVTEDPSSAVDPDVAAGRAAIDARDWPAAMRAHAPDGVPDARNADSQNYLGYAYRHTGQMDRAFEH